MLTSLLLALTMQLPMSGIIEREPAIIQEKIIIKKIYVVIDKFGVEHEGENKATLLKEITEINKKVFKLQDKSGQWWEHQDEATLRQFIYNRNIEIEYARMRTGHVVLDCDSIA